MDNFQPYMLMMMSSFKSDNISNFYLYLSMLLLPIISNMIPYNDIKICMYAYVMSPMYRSLTYDMINTLPEGKSS